MSSRFAILLVALSSYCAALAEDSKQELELRRLDTLIDLAEAKRDCSRIKGSLDRLASPNFEAAKDLTLERLNKQLGAAEREFNKLKDGASSSSPEAVKRMKLVRERVDSLRADVQLAQESLQRYFQRELDRAQVSVKALSAKLKDIQRELDLPPPFEPPVVVVNTGPVIQIPPPQPPPMPVTTPTPAPPPKPEQVASPQMGAVRENKADHLDYVYVAAGSFRLGCADGERKCDKDKDKDELPAHPVTLTRGFWLGETEVTVGAYLTFARATNRPMPKASKNNADWRLSENPISRVTYKDAADFCAWTGGRLPTEAEWEYAARGGTTTTYPWGDEADHEMANFEGQSKDRKNGRDKFWELANVRSFEPNAWGVYDMLGNVAEFVADWYGPYTAGPVTDPKGPASGEERLLRGGSYGATPDQLRVSRRDRVNPGAFANYIGFRCVLDK